MICGFFEGSEWVLRFPFVQIDISSLKRVFSNVFVKPKYRSHPETEIVLAKKTAKTKDSIFRFLDLATSRQGNVTATLAILNKV